MNEKSVFDPLSWFAQNPKISWVDQITKKQFVLHWSSSTPAFSFPPKSYHFETIIIENHHVCSGLWKVVKTEIDAAKGMSLYCEVPMTSTTVDDSEEDNSSRTSKVKMLTKVVSTTSASVIENSKSTKQLLPFTVKRQKNGDNITICEHSTDFANEDVKVSVAPPLRLTTRGTIFTIYGIDNINQTFKSDIGFECRLREISLIDNINFVESALLAYGDCSFVTLSRSSC